MKETNELLVPKKYPRSNMATLRQYKFAFPRNGGMPKGKRTSSKSEGCLIEYGHRAPTEDSVDWFKARKDLFMALLLLFLLACISSNRNIETHRLASKYLRDTVYQVEKVRRHLKDSLEVSDVLFGEANGDNFGSAIAMTANGRRYVVGAKYHGAGLYHDSGRVDVYDHHPTGTSKIEQVIHGEGIGENYGKAVAVSGSGDRLAVAGKGDVRIYEWMSDSKYKMADTMSYAGDGETGKLCNLGHRLALSEDGRKLVVASWNEGTSSCIPRNVGVQTYLLKEDSGWKKAGKLNVDADSISSLGYAIAMTPNGKCLVVGQPGRDNTSFNPMRSAVGSTTIYKWQGGRWMQLGQELLGVTKNARSGFSVAVSSDCARVVEGAPFSTAGGADAGRVTIYDFDDATSSWVEESHQDGTAHDHYGTSVSLASDGTRLAVGAPRSSPSGAVSNDRQGNNKIGFVRIYDWSGTIWEQYGQDFNGAAPNDLFGYNLELSNRGHRLLVSSPLHESDGKHDSGSVQILTLTPNNLPCPMSDGDLWVTACRSHVQRSDGGLCSRCTKNVDCVGGGVTSYCSPDQLCVPLEQVRPGCRCQNHRDCFGYEDLTHICHHSPSTSSTSPFGTWIGRKEGHCIPAEEAI